AERFDSSKVYDEKAVNEIIKAIFNDFVTIRRYLIEYGFLARTQDCKEYWVKK
ncbi:MAG: transcriptional regulator, partial [Haloplasmataceae bacterium]|nr:transcriptional regulator [Haloplasmataceae bacterium]